MIWVAIIAGIILGGLVAWRAEGGPHALAKELSKRTGPHANRIALKAWIKQNMPELDAELGPLNLDQVRMRLNAVTGCNVQGHHSVEDGSAVFLAALQAPRTIWKDEP